LTAPDTSISPGWIMIKGLHLNGTWYGRDALIDRALAKRSDLTAPEWERAFWRFLADWFDEQDYLLVQTSGSTGKPKTLAIPKHFFINSARMTLDFLQIKPGDRALLCLSPAYIAGKMMIVRALIGGLKLTLVSPQVSSILNHNDATDFSAMVPIQVQTILDQPEGRERIENIDTLLIGGGPISRDLAEHLQNFDNRIYETYGMTETVSHIALRRLNGPDRCPYFTLMGGVKINTDTNHCLVIDAPALAENKLHTRDIVSVIGNDQFEVISRFDHVINSGGIKYYPEVIERKLAQLIPHRFIISSMPDQRLGEKLILIIESTDHLKYEGEKLEQTLKKILPPYEVPKKIIFLIKFPVVGNGKLSRKTITRVALKEKSIEVEED
jgi:o-succinylbenzoate---CoA ligase